MEDFPIEKSKDFILSAECNSKKIKLSTCKGRCESRFIQGCSLQKNLATQLLFQNGNLMSIEEVIKALNCVSQTITFFNQSPEPHHKLLASLIQKELKDFYSMNKSLNEREKVSLPELNIMPINMEWDCRNENFLLHNSNREDSCLKANSEGYSSSISNTPLHSAAYFLNLETHETRCSFNMATPTIEEFNIGSLVNEAGVPSYSSQPLMEDNNDLVDNNCSDINAVSMCYSSQSTSSYISNFHHSQTGTHDPCYQKTLNLSLDNDPSTLVSDKKNQFRDAMLLPENNLDKYSILNTPKKLVNSPNTDKELFSTPMTCSFVSSTPRHVPKVDRKPKKLSKYLKHSKIKLKPCSVILKKLHINNELPVFSNSPEKVKESLENKKCYVDPMECHSPIPLTPILLEQKETEGSCESLAEQQILNAYQNEGHHSLSVLDSLHNRTSSDMEKEDILSIFADGALCEDYDEYLNQSSYTKSNNGKKDSSSSIASQPNSTDSMKNGEKNASLNTPLEKAQSKSVIYQEDTFSVSSDMLSNDSLLVSIEDGEISIDIDRLHKEIDYNVNLVRLDCQYCPSYFFKNNCIDHCELSHSMPEKELLDFLKELLSSWFTSMHKTQIWEVFDHHMKNLGFEGDLNVEVEVLKPLAEKLFAHQIKIEKNVPRSKKALLYVALLEVICDAGDAKGACELLLKTFYSMAAPNKKFMLFSFIRLCEKFLLSNLRSPHEIMKNWECVKVSQFKDKLDKIGEEADQHWVLYHMSNDNYEMACLSFYLLSSNRCLKNFNILAYTFIRFLQNKDEHLQALKVVEVLHSLQIKDQKVFRTLVNSLSKVKGHKKMIRKYFDVLMELEVVVSSNRMSTLLMPIAMENDLSLAVNFVHYSIEKCAKEPSTKQVLCLIEKLGAQERIDLHLLRSLIGCLSENYLKMIAKDVKLILKKVPHSPDVQCIINIFCCYKIQLDLLKDSLPEPDCNVGEPQDGPSRENLTEEIVEKKTEKPLNDYWETLIMNHDYEDIIKEIKETSFPEKGQKIVARLFWIFVNDSLVQEMPRYFQELIQKFPELNENDRNILGLLASSVVVHISNLIPMENSGPLIVTLLKNNILFYNFTPIQNHVSLMGIAIIILEVLFKGQLYLDMIAFLKDGPWLTSTDLIEDRVGLFAQILAHLEEKNRYDLFLPVLKVVVELSSSDVNSMGAQNYGQFIDLGKLFTALWNHGLTIQKDDNSNFNEILHFIISCRSSNILPPNIASHPCVAQSQNTFKGDRFSHFINHPPPPLVMRLLPPPLYGGGGPSSMLSPFSRNPPPSAPFFRSFERPSRSRGFFPRRARKPYRRW